MKDVIREVKQFFQCVLDIYIVKQGVYYIDIKIVRCVLMLLEIVDVGVKFSGKGIVKD